MFSLTDVKTAVFGEGRNRLFCLDTACPQEALAIYGGQAQAVYLDPPFLTGETFQRRRSLGEENWQSGKLNAAFPAFRDRAADRGAYLGMLRGMLENGRRLLTDSGVLMLHLDWRASAHARLLCDELFGENCFINEVIWAYESGGRAKRTFSRKHDTILLYGKTEDWRLDPARAAIPRSTRRRSHLRRGVDEEGRPYGSMVVRGKEYRYYDTDPITPGDVWTDISHLQQRDPERTGWPTQKPEKLLSRLFSCTLERDELAVDLCCGSGTAAAVAEQLGARFVACDLNPVALADTATRLRLRNFSMSLPAPAEGDRAALYGTVEESGMVMLAGFASEDPAFPAHTAPMDLLDAWAPGWLRDGVFHGQEAMVRSRRHPGLPPISLLNAGEGAPAVLTVDAAGRIRVFAWTQA